MFGRVLTKIFKRGTPVVPSETSKSPTSTPPAVPSERSESPFGRKSAATTLPTPAVDTPAAPEPAVPAADSVKQQWKAKSNKSLNAKESPDVLCGVNKSMSKEEISEKLAVLYRRHNRAASSLDAKMREEAEIMLEAIATVKEKYLSKK